MSAKSPKAQEKDATDKWESGDQLIHYSRVSPLARWSKRLFWFVVIFLIPTAICFLLWWTGLAEPQRLELIADYPNLQQVEERVPVTWYRASAPPTPQQPIAQAQSQKPKPKPRQAKSPALDEPVVTYQPPRKLSVKPRATVGDGQVTVGATADDFQPDSDMLTMTMAEYEQWKKQVEDSDQEKEKIARAYMDNGGILISWKAWEKRRPLNWGDFRNPSVDKRNKWGASVSVSISMTRGRLAHHAFAFMIPEGSWKRMGYGDEAILRHEQAHFDIAELYARKLRSRLAARKPLNNRDAYNLYVEILNELTLMQADYDQQTVHGSLRDAQAKWESDIQVAMEKFAEWEWLPSWKNKANANHADAQFYLAQAYANGTDGYPQSDKLAKSWYARAITNRSEEAANNLGVLNLLGRVPKSSDKKAFRYFRKAANRSYIGQFNLAVMYLQGKGTQPSREKAMELFTHSAQVFTLSQMALVALEQAPPEDQEARQAASQ